MEKKILMKNNDLIKAKYNLSLTYSNVFISVLYKLQREDNGQGVCIISRDEFKSIIQNKNDQSLRRIKIILSDLMNEKIFFKEEREDDVIWGEYNIISGFEYSEAKEEFKIICSPRVYELLTSYMQIGYTPVNLIIFLSLKSIYAQRLYELLRLWSNTKKVISYEVAELRELFMLENKYKKYNDFKKNVINVAVDMLNETGMFNISFTENKVGRSVKSIEFTVEDLDDRIYFKKGSEIIENSPLIENTEILNESSTEPTVNEYGVPIYDYIPDEKMLSKGVKMLFFRKFGEYNFRDEYAENAFFDAVAKTMDKDNVDVVDMKLYKYFEKTLIERLDYYIKEDIKKNMY